MRNRFRPNITPRGSRSTTNSTSKNASDTSNSVPSPAVPSTSGHSTSSSTSHDLDTEKTKLDSDASKNTTNIEKVDRLEGNKREHV